MSTGSAIAHFSALVSFTSSNESMVVVSRLLSLIYRLMKKKQNEKTFEK